MGNAKTDVVPCFVLPKPSFAESLNTGKRENCGYEIVTALQCSKRMELVIGNNPKAPNPWVCWYCYDGKSYSTGDYCNTFKEALQSLADRINRNMCFSDFADLYK